MSEGVLQKPTELGRKEQSSMDHQERIGYGVPIQFREVHINLPTRLSMLNFHHYHVSHVTQ